MSYENINTKGWMHFAAKEIYTIYLSSKRTAGQTINVGPDDWRVVYRDQREPSLIFMCSIHVADEIKTHTVRRLPLPSRRII
jgi:hypothetical protein